MTAGAHPELQVAWQRYYSNLEDMRALIESTDRFANNPQDRAKAYHCLMEMQALAYNLTVAPRMAQPRLSTNLTWQTDIHASGITGPERKI